MHASLLVLAFVAIIALASAQLPLSLPPDVRFVNSQNASVSANFQGIPVTGSGSFQYTADEGVKAVQTHGKFNVNFMGQPMAVEFWATITSGSHGTWTMTGATSQNGQCQRNMANQNVATLKCGGWAKTASEALVVNKWLQKCAIDMAEYDLRVEFSATTTDGQLNIFQLNAILNGTALGTFGFNVNQQSNEVPSGATFQPPADCAPPSLGSMKRMLELLGL